MFEIYQDRLIIKGSHERGETDQYGNYYRDDDDGDSGYSGDSGSRYLPPFFGHFHSLTFVFAAHTAVVGEAAGPRNRPVGNVHTVCLPRPLSSSYFSFSYGQAAAKGRRHVEAQAVAVNARGAAEPRGLPAPSVRAVVRSVHRRRILLFFSIYLLTATPL